VTQFNEAVTKSTASAANQDGPLFARCCLVNGDSGMTDTFWWMQALLEWSLLDVIK
jgi:hypothetical protein